MKDLDKININNKEQLEDAIYLMEKYLEVLNFIKDAREEFEKQNKVEEVKEYIIEYPETSFTWAEGDIVNGNYPFDAYDLTKWADLGEVRATEEQAEEAIRRNIRGNRLEALAHSIGGVYEFSSDKKNFFIYFDSETLEANFEWVSSTCSAETVYMSYETACKVVEILNSGTYKLNIKPEGN